PAESRSGGGGGVLVARRPEGGRVVRSPHHVFVEGPPWEAVPRGGGVPHRAGPGRHREVVRPGCDEAGSCAYCWESPKASEYGTGKRRRCWDPGSSPSVTGASEGVSVLVARGGDRPCRARVTNLWVGEGQSTPGGRHNRGWRGHGCGPVSRHRHELSKSPALALTCAQVAG